MPEASDGVRMMTVARLARQLPAQALVAANPFARSAQRLRQLAQEPSARAALASRPPPAPPRKEEEE